MKIEKYQGKIKLNAEEIDGFSDKIEEAFAAIKMERLNRFRIRLSLEEMLLRYRDRFGEDKEVEVYIDSYFGRPFVEIDLEGDIYNPLNKTEVELEQWNDSLITAIGLSPEYSYAHGRNILRFILPVQRMNPALKIIIAIALGVVAGLIGRSVISPDVQEAVNTMALEPAYNIWSSILLLLSGPVIFLMVITTMLNTGAVAEQGGNTGRIVFRYFALSFLVGFISIVASSLVFSPGFVDDLFDDNILSGLLGPIMQLIPDNIVEPLLQANTPQILELAFILGGALLVVGGRAKQLTRILKQMNMLGMQITEWVSRGVPYFSGVLVALEIIVGRTALISKMLDPLIISVIVSVICFLAVLAYVSAVKGVNIKLLAKKLWPPFKTAMVKGSLDASFGQAEQTTVHKLGVEKNYAAVELPQGLVLYMPINVIGTIAFTVFAAVNGDVKLSLVWIVTAIVLSVVLFVATPPVPGANLLAYIVIFAQLGIDGEVLIDAMIFDIIFGIFASAANQAMLQLELVLQADSIGLLARDKLIS